MDTWSTYSVLVNYEQELSMHLWGTRKWIFMNGQKEWKGTDVESISYLCGIEGKQLNWSFITFFLLCLSEFCMYVPPLHVISLKTAYLCFISLIMHVLNIMISLLNQETFPTWVGVDIFPCLRSTTLNFVYGFPADLVTFRWKCYTICFIMDSVCKTTSVLING